jgi:hypothetical protein
MRIYTSQSYAVDYCNRCAPKTEDKALALHGHDGDGPDDRGNCFGYDDERPAYDEDPDMVYNCHKCKKKLTEKNAGGIIFHHIVW